MEKSMVSDLIVNLFTIIYIIIKLQFITIAFKINILIKV
jgi:hypothetical protein